MTRLFYILAYILVLPWLPLVHILLDWDFCFWTTYRDWWTSLKSEFKHD